MAREDVNAVERPAKPAERLVREDAPVFAGKLVAVVDDDESVRESLPDLLRELGYLSRAFASAEAFLGSDCLEETDCLILDVAMPGMSGPQLQRELLLRDRAVPIIFVTAQSDAALRPRLVAQGAVECLFKPFSEQELRAALRAATG
jgi:FixJ family two-component response regulator